MDGIPKDYYKYGLAAALGLAAIVEYDKLDLVYNTLGRDLQSAFRYANLLRSYKSLQKANMTMPDFFRETVKKYPNKPMLISVETEEVWTFSDMDAYTNRIANYFLKNGFHRGDVVGIFMENKPKYVACIIGLAKIGVTSALINYQLSGESLLHSITTANCSGIIYDFDKEQSLSGISYHLKSPNEKLPFQFYCMDIPQGSLPSLAAKLFEKDLTLIPTSPVPMSVRKHMRWNDELLYIFTSGTTGLPKASRGDHGRFSLGSLLAIQLNGVKDTDRLYTTMPLYHASGQWFAIGTAIYGGTTVIIRKNFSATNFWTDCIKFEATVSQYIGEICRFLLAAPSTPEETQHKLRLMYGVGLRAKIWTDFVERFKIPKIIEMYGSTEGTIGGLNTFGKVGAIGYISKLFPILPFNVIKVDDEGNIIRDPKTGFCIKTQPDEPGEIIGGIRDDDRGGPKNFEAYANNPAENEKKVLRNVFKKGDAYFRSGDIVTMDKYGWLFFKDRTGDTFRWRGENVSTTEVETVIAKMINHRDTVCYGVEIPGVEGKAGMVAFVDPDESVNLEKLSAEIDSKLPRYARPLFLRRLKESATLTGTYKLVKRDLQKEGYNIDILDPDVEIFFKGPVDKSFRRLDQQLYNEILNNFHKAKL